MFPSHCQYLRFYLQNQAFQFKALCFGPTSAPRVFTKIVSVVAAYLRTKNIRLVVYLDDWLIINQQKAHLCLDRAECLNLLVSLGFIVNKEKSKLVPSQKLIYLGAFFDLEKGLIFPTQERIDKLNLAIQKIMKEIQVTALDFLHLLGIMASCIELIPNARLYMRPIQLHLLSFWRPACQEFKTLVPVTQHLKSHLIWWSTDLYNHNYRCFKNRLWGCNGQENFSRGMVCFREQETHKLPGIRSSSAYNQTFSKLSDREICTDKIRQHNIGPVHQQTRGDQITSVVLQNLGTLDFSNSIQYNPESSSYNGKEKHNCRLSEQEKNSAYRVVTEHSNCTETFSLVGPTPDGFICLGREPSDESVLLMDSTSPSFCLGCPDNILGENVCLRISPNLPDTQDIAIYEAVPVSDSPDSFFVAQETLVPGITSTIDRLPSQSADTIRPSLSTEVPSLSSGPGGIQSDCLASINRSFQAEGFSKEARNLLSASWRKGTQKDYSAKFKKYCSWCSTRKLIPIMQL
ncbi:unnamed protein product [Mytilus coruscus]|uniref:Reverse transcriptase domain-containing protein n=1 Tax=Mytilus coruscus TaxID=42192 RepID=A0A6J7ZWB0_MYTCO|nr:unnamed protein product [Mytilus coruscus]